MIEIKGYQVKEQIHESRSSIIYKGISLSDKKPVILKLLKKEYPSSEEIARFRREYEVTKSISFEGVIQAYKLEKYKNTLVMVMEDFGGETFLSWINSKKPKMEEFLFFAIKLVDALIQIHSQNIMHKDVNPNNIMINSKSKQLKLVDFGISSQLSHENALIFNPIKFEGTLAYMSPEQTGRMNRSIDYRTDLYSLGVTLYETISGTLPFKGENAMDLVHCHIAKTAKMPHLENSEIPLAVSEIIMKLMAKTADERYQSARGLKNDLTICLNQLKASGKIDTFKIGQKDIPESFQIPEKLYGRENEIKKLLDIFDRVAKGNSELMLVTGYSGIGKSVLVNEIHKPIVKKKGYFISGKFDQFQHNIPYLAVIRAIQDLVKQLLSEPENKLKNWKDKLLAAMGQNAQIIIDIIPEMEYVVGKQTPVQELNPTEAQNRFRITFNKFVKVFAQKEHPLVIFLDDLQWCDPPSLNLIQNLITEEIDHLLIIGAYRDSEISKSHSLLLFIEEIRKSKNIHSIHLKPLEEIAVNQIIADTLHCKPDNAAALSKIVFKRTEGNPFFIKELLKNLFKNGFLSYKQRKGRWDWELEKIKEIKIRSNVVEFMIDRLNKLSDRCRESLKFAACIGNSFDIKTLSVIMEKSVPSTANILWDAIKEEIIIPLSDKYKLVNFDESSDIQVRYKFQHDRVQQAAYSLIEEDLRNKAHLKIGRLILQNSTKVEMEDRLIEIVSHFNKGKDLITDSKEREQLVKLNLKAGKKAAFSTAYQVSLLYLKTGIELLTVNPWADQYQLALSLNMEYAQSAYLTGNYDVAEERIELMLANVKTKLEKVGILSMRSRQYTTLGKHEEAIRQGIRGLLLLGIKLSEKPGKLSILMEVLQAKWNLGRRKIASLIDAPELTDPEKKIAARLLMEMGAPAYVTGNDELYGLLALKVVNLSLRYGNTPESAYAYVAYGMVLSVALGDFKSGYEFGKLALALNEKFKDIEYKCRVIVAYGVLIHHWNNHWSTLSILFEQGIEAGYQSGDLFYLAYSAQNTVAWNPKIDLATSCKEQNKYLQVVKETGFQDALDSATMLLQLHMNFQGLTKDTFSLDSSYFDELRCLQDMKQRKYISGIAMYHLHKADICLFYDNYSLAIQHIHEGDKVIQSLVGLTYTLRFCLIAFLSSSACLSLPSNEKKKVSWKHMKKKYRQMKKWAKHNPDNFRHLQLIMEAEMAMHSNELQKASHLYDQAIKAANQNEWLRDEALANELAAKFYLKIGKEKAAVGYMKDAHYLYYRWGASAKTIHLEKYYPHLIKNLERGRYWAKETQTATISSSVSAGRSGSEILDLTTIMKSSQTISSEIVLETLLEKIMNIVLKNAGAQKGFLLLETDNELFIEAKAVAENDEIVVVQHIPVIDSNEIAQTIINYVSRSKEEVVLDDATNQGEFTRDSYIFKYKPKSILCMPLIRQNKLYGILYLQNDLTIAAFTPERIELLNILSSQMAISIENALLYDNLEQKVKERTKEVVKQKDDIKRLNDSKEQFFSVIAHDLRGPIGNIKLFIDLILGKLSKKEFQDSEKLLHLIGRQSASAFNILENLLAWTNSQRNQISYTPNQQRLSHAIVSSLELLEASALRKNISIQNNINQHLEAYFDNTLISTVIRNLIANAIQFTPENGIITLTASEKEDMVEISVSDTGVGISENRVKTLFEITTFETTTGTNHEKGSGLGLKLVKEFVEKNGGEIWLESEIGKGSTFIFSLLRFPLEH